MESIPGQAPFEGNGAGGRPESVIFASQVDFSFQPREVFMIPSRVRDTLSTLQAEFALPALADPLMRCAP